jgi:lysophospholipase L1-like esterase
MDFVGIRIISSILSLTLIISFIVLPARASKGLNPSTQTVRGIENAATLQSFYAELEAVKFERRRAPVRIVQYGDSHTAADLMTGTVRKNFQRDYMSASASPGVVFDAYGINGARAVRLTSWSDGVFATNFARRQPDLIILAYGTNEVTDENWSIESYHRMFAGILRRLKRIAPRASLLVVAPPDRAVRRRGGWQSVSRLPALIEAQRRAAIDVGAAFWSQYGAMGGAGSMNTWVEQGLAQADHVHLTRAGYARMGEMFYQDFQRAYQAQTLDASQRLDLKTDTADLIDDRSDKLWASYRTSGR